MSVCRRQLYFQHVTALSAVRQQYVHAFTFDFPQCNPDDIIIQV